MANRRGFFGGESIEEKTKKYTRPHPIVTSHLRNQLQHQLFTKPTWVAHSMDRGFMQPQIIIPPLLTPTLPAIAIQPSSFPHQQQVNRKRNHSNNIESPSYNKRTKYSSDSKYSTFTDELYNHIETHKQSDRLLQSKLRLRNALLTIFRRQFPDSSLHLVGSSCNGFATDNSDADFCLMLSHHRSIDRMESLHVLKSLQKLLRNVGFVKQVQFIRAKVPILKFRDNISGCECDVNINNSIGIRNTHLLRSYSRIDDRVCPMVMSIKNWAKSRQINDASQGTLSSYSLVLMVLHYLQSACKPPVLMSLQQDFPTYFDYNKNVDELPMFEPADHIQCNSSANNQSLGELIDGFFAYYATNFNFNYLAISVRLGRATPKSLYPEWKDKFICVEEPFELTNTARAVYEFTRFELIKRELKRAHTQLKSKLSLNCIL